MEYLGFINKELILFTIVYTIAVLALNCIWLRLKGLKSCKESIGEFISERGDRWKSHSGLKKTYFVLAIVAVPIFLYSFWFIFPEFIDKIYDKETSFYNLSLAVFAILSGLGAVFGFYTSIIRTETAEQGQITERLNKAIENLGKITEKDDPVIEVRIGALLSLERIAKDSIRDHIQILEIICAYICYNSLITDETDKMDKMDKFARLREDIQVALTIIGRRDKWHEGKKRIRKEKQQGYNITLLDCNLQRAQLDGANLSGAWMSGTDLTHAYLGQVDISNATLYSLDISGACLDMIKLGGADIEGLIAERAYAYTGDFSTCETLTQNHLEQMFFGSYVKISNKLTRPKHWPIDRQSKEDFLAKYKEWSIARIRATIKKTSPETHPKQLTTNN